MFLSLLPRCCFSEGAAAVVDEGGGGGAGTTACCLCFFFGSGSLESPSDGHATTLSTRGAAGAAGVGTFHAGLDCFTTASVTCGEVVVVVVFSPSCVVETDVGVAATVAAAAAGDGVGEASLLDATAALLSLAWFSLGFCAAAVAPSALLVFEREGAAAALDEEVDPVVAAPPFPAEDDLGIWSLLVALSVASVLLAPALLVFVGSCGLDVASPVLAFTIADQGVARGLAASYRYKRTKRSECEVSLDGNLVRDVDNINSQLHA